jgi:hypothetical protein
MSRGRFSVSRLGALLALASALACQPRIGDDCLVDLDCSQIGDRICDSTQPGGYCTQFNCGPTSCPEDESICVAFGNTPSAAYGCGNLGRGSPYVRNFCMQRCEKAADCRDGYECLDVALENPWGATVIEQEPELTTVCVLPSTAASVDPRALEDLDENVCSGPSLGGAGGAGG